jgi:hypothetical protein
MTKSLISILFLTFVLLSCRNDSNELYAKYIRQFQSSIQNLEKQNKPILNKFEDMLSLNESRIVPYYKSLCEIIKYKSELEHIIDSIQPIKDSVLLKEILLKGDINQDQSNKKLCLKKEEISLIRKKLDDYKKNLFLLIDRYPKHQGLIHAVEKRLSTEYFDSIRTFSPKPVNQLELLACFYRIKADIAIVNKNMLSYLYCLLGGESYRFTHIQPFIVPNARILPFGYQYSAEIFLATCYNMKPYDLEIEGRKFEVESEVGHYMERVTGRPGIHEKNGYCLVKSPFTGQTHKIPFKIEYEVIEKK